MVAPQTGGGGSSTGGGPFPTVLPITAADGTIITLGSEADPKDSHTDATPITVVSVLKQVSYYLSNPLAVTGTFWQATQPTSSVDGAHVSIGNTADAATATTVIGRLQKLISLLPSVLVGDRLKVDGSGVTQPVSGTFWQATQPVSGTFYQATQPVSIAGTVTVNGSGVTQPVSGTFWQATQPVSIAGTVTVNGSGVTQPVSGTFWQATQPVSSADGGLVTLGNTADAATATTVIGRLQKLVALLPTALAANGGLKVEGVAGGVAQPTSIADGSLITLGAKTDAKNTATDGTSISAMQVLKQISAYLSGIIVVNASGFTQPVSLVSQPSEQGAASQNAINLTAGTVATLAIARATRVALTVVNEGTTAIRIGPHTQTISATVGLLLNPGASATISYVGLIDFCAVSGTPAVSALDEYN